jgi:hypothetical protein
MFAALVGATAADNGVATRQQWGKIKGAVRSLATLNALGRFSQIFGTKKQASNPLSV